MQNNTEKTSQDMGKMPENIGDDTFAGELAAQSQEKPSSRTPNYGISDDDPATNSFAL